MQKRGFYIVKEEFFDEINDRFLKRNKSGNRPHYYCFEDSKEGIMWLIPLSSKIDKYEELIKKKEREGKSCDIVHITKLTNNRKSAFLIQDMFPITEEYIEREYTIAGTPLILGNEREALLIERKAKKIMAMLKQGVRFTPTQPDVIAILSKLRH